MTRTASLAALAALLPLAFAGTASAQESFPACQTQQALEQVMASDGSLMPDDCRELTVTEVRSDSGRLCVIDFAGAGEGVLQQLRDAALPEQWWVRCDRLEQAAE
ncbi:MAG: hypothetical protein WD341_04570 [Tistlia sp.]|uniref:hypothetical protein n=1 Tax=Tistlia sp. TaxID=3057121 RepID=UPI0034A58EA7